MQLGLDTEMAKQPVGQIGTVRETPEAPGQAVLDSKIIPSTGLATSTDNRSSWRSFSSTKCTELETLECSRWRRVVMAPLVDQVKFTSEDCGQGGCLMSNDRQSATSLRAIQSKRGDDDIASRLNGFFQPLNISGLIGLSGQEMKCGAVVPQIVALGWFPFRDVSDFPGHDRGSFSKTFLRRLESRR